MRLFVSLCLAFLVLGAVIVPAQTTPAALTGKWEITLEFISGKAVHTAQIAQKDSTFSGTYKGSVKEGQLRGMVRGNKVTFSTALRNQAASAPFSFTGTVNGDTMSGTVDMGEFWSAKWTAKKVKE